MSPTPVPTSTIDPFEPFPADQRSQQRFPMALEVEYRLLGRGRTERNGSGRTVNISSGGALIHTPEHLSAGVTIELAVEWPFLLEGVCPLKLIMRGRVVRVEARGVAIKAKHHEFRTSGARNAKIAASGAPADKGGV